MSFDRDQMYRIRSMIAALSPELDTGVSAFRASLARRGYDTLDPQRNANLRRAFACDFAEAAKAIEDPRKFGAALARVNARLFEDEGGAAGARPDRGTVAAALLDGVKAASGANWSTSQEPDWRALANAVAVQWAPAEAARQRIAA